jgi:hypothetical protein
MRCAGHGVAAEPQRSQGGERTEVPDLSVPPHGYPFFLRVLVYSEAGFYATIRKIFPKRNCRSGLQ